MIHDLSVHDAAIGSEHLLTEQRDGLFQENLQDRCSPAPETPTSADRMALPFLQAPPDLSLVTTVTEAGCPTQHSSSPAPMASLWLATALMETSTDTEADVRKPSRGLRQS